MFERQQKIVERHGKTVEGLRAKRAPKAISERGVPQKSLRCEMCEREGQGYARLCKASKAGIRR